MVEDSGINLFTLNPDTYDALSFRFDNQMYTLSNIYYYYYYYYNQVYLKPIFPLWSSIETQPWTSVCMVLDLNTNVIQVFEGGSVSVRKISSLTVRAAPTQIKDLFPTVAFMVI